MHNGEGDNFSIDSATGMGFCHSQCGKGWDILGLEIPDQFAEDTTKTLQQFVNELDSLKR